jgi:hypothetical protein
MLNVYDPIVALSNITYPVSFVTPESVPIPAGCLTDKISVPFKGFPLLSVIRNFSVVLLVVEVELEVGVGVGEELGDEVAVGLEVAEGVGVGVGVGAGGGSTVTSTVPIEFMYPVFEALAVIVHVVVLVKLRAVKFVL